MTHLESVIRDVKKFIPKPKRNKVVKQRVLSKLYAIEAKEKPKRKQHKIARRKQQSISSSIGHSFNSYLVNRARKQQTARPNIVSNFFARRQALKAKEREITQRKENLGYVHIDPKLTHRQAQQELKTGKPIVLRGESPNAMQ